MLSFESDYTEGAHPLILERLAETNFEQLSGYGSDKYSDPTLLSALQQAGRPMKMISKNSKKY